MVCAQTNPFFTKRLCALENVLHSFYLRLLIKTNTEVKIQKTGKNYGQEGIRLTKLGVTDRD